MNVILTSLYYLLFMKVQIMLVGKINWNGCIANDLNIETPDLNDLSKQFQMKSSTTENSTLFSEINLNHHVPILDDEITVNEVKAAHSVLKEDKSSADGWVKAMVTNISLCILYVFQIIYNSILNFHIYPSTWRTTIVNAIFKNKGSRGSAKYYRGISIVYLMAKIFDIIPLKKI